MQRELKRNLSWIAAGTAGLLLLDAYVLERYFFKVKKYDIGDLNGDKAFNIILLTDLHLRNSLAPKYRRLAARIKSLKPDIIVISGDVIDQNGNERTLDQFLSLLENAVPIVAIPGNHEHKAAPKISTIKKIYQKHGVDLLINESRRYQINGTHLMITGLDDAVEGEENVCQALLDVKYEEHHIGLIHSPLQQEKMMKQIKKINKGRKKEEKINISYLFAGHNHGGQVTFFGLFPLLLPKGSGNYINGWYNDQKPCLYVSKGFGTSTVPFRFGARAEMVVFDYHY